MATVTPKSATCLKDEKLIWHPFTQHAIDASPIAISHGAGALVFSEEGKCFIDGIASWWTNLHGHCHKEIAKAIYDQAMCLEHVMFANFTHLPAVTLAERLLPLLPGKPDRLFFSDNGSTAVETALKMALQYFYNSGVKKNKILALQNSYHGDTFGAMSAAGKNHFNKPFWPYLFETALITAPTKGNEELFLHQLNLHLQSGKIAAFIYEPVIQAAAGMVKSCPDALSEALRLCKKSGALTIADEVMTGFGRLGPLFASELLDETPDIICLAKGLTGGFLPLAVTSCKEEVFEKFLSEDRFKALLHGHTYTANPLGCSAAIKSLELLLSDECSKNRLHIQRRHEQFCHDTKVNWERKEVTGTLLALEYPSKKGKSGYDSSIAPKLSKFFNERGVILRPLGNTVHVLPPYCISNSELDTLYEALNDSLKKVEECHD